MRYNEHRRGNEKKKKCRCSRARRVHFPMTLNYFVFAANQITSLTISHSEAFGYIVKMNDKTSHIA